MFPSRPTTWQRGSPLRALTLIEILVVLAVIGILAAILLPALGRVRENARRGFCLNNLNQFGKALTLYQNVFGEYLPSAPGWGVSPSAYSLSGMTLYPYAGHQGLSRHMIVGYGGEDADAENNLVPGKLNFVPVGLGALVAREDIDTRLLICRSMQSGVSTAYGPAAYPYDPAMPVNLGNAPGKPLVTADGRKLNHVPTAGGKTVTAVLSSYSYRNTPFYSRRTPANAPSGWTYTADEPSLADHSSPGQPWVAEWALEGPRPEVRVPFMCPPWKTGKRLGGRAICADTFDATPAQPCLMRFHHRDGLNVLYGDGHAGWFSDDADRFKDWKDWADPANPGTDNLTISSASSQKAWRLFDQAAGIDGP